MNRRTAPPPCTFNVRKAGDAVAFATTDDVLHRLGRDGATAPLTAGEMALATFLLDASTAVIALTAGKDDAWAAALDPVPQILRIVCVEQVNRVMSNPAALASSSETLGAYQRSQSFRNLAAGELLPTSSEELLIRRAVHGRVTGSACIGSGAVRDYVLAAFEGLVVSNEVPSIEFIE